MKKHLAMIVGGYYPTPSPTGKCAEQYVSLIQDDYEIDVVCIARSDDKSYAYNKKKYIRQVVAMYIFKKK